MTEPIKVEVTLDIDRHLARFSSRGDEFDAHPITLEDLVVEGAVRALVHESTLGTAPLSDSLKRRVKEIRDEEIRDALLPMIQEALTGPLEITNTFGEGRGGTTTLREEILKTSKELFAVKSVREDLRRENATPVQKIIREEISRALDKELKEALAEAKAEVISAVREKGAEVLARTISEMAGAKA